MGKAVIRNAKITNTVLGREGHGIFTFEIFIEFSGCTCACGGYALDEPGYDKDNAIIRVYSKKSMEIIGKILDVVGVDTWEELPNKYIRIVDNGWGTSVDEIGNLMEEKWLNFREFFKDDDND